MSNVEMVVTAALPYANGAIHIGHLVEYLQADIWTRFQKMRGRRCLYICADDTHGTPIMVRARNEGITPEQLIARSYKEHLADFTDFEIEFDHYSSTNSETNRKFSEEIYRKMVENGHIDRRDVQQSFCDHDKMFLPDRFVKGTCPKCGARDQYGDSCDVCGSTYSPTELKSPKCAICGNPPVEKASEHYFFQLGHFNDFLSGWVKAHTQAEIANKLQEWLKEGLRDWDISRDAPYFGFKIPGTQDKYFYVWVDAPVGYISSTKEWCDRHGADFEAIWRKGDCEIHHFIGKDIVYFHTLFWPAMLNNAGFKTPTRVHVHGFLTVNGEKMSKSKGTFVSARTYLNNLNPIYLRYYYASKLTSTVTDIDLNLEDFANRVNSDLIGKITNMASRGAQMLHKKLDGKTGSLSADDRRLVMKAQAAGDEIARHYQSLDYGKALVEIRNIAEDANKYFDAKEPWKLVKEDTEKTREVLTAALNLFRLMAIYLKPVLPSYVNKVEKLFGEKPYTWDSAKEFFENRAVQPYEHLATRVEMPNVEKMIEDSKAGK